VEEKRKKHNITKIWEKHNKKHYPDSEWVWTQIENSESPALLFDAIEKRYALKKHGNTGNPGNRWKNKSK
jgi:hypothetical protein